MRLSRLRQLWLPSTAVLLVLGLIAGAVLALFPSATRSSQLIATAAILGGLIMAAGTALAVYLTVATERAVETEKIEAALRMEVAEFARQAASRLFLLRQRVLGHRVRIPVRDLPALMEMPEAVVYKATAPRIGRLSYGPLLVIFHGRIAEAVSMARTYAVTPANIADGKPTLEPWIKDRAAEKMAIAWLIVCEMARSILRTVPEEIADAAMASRLEKLDKDIAQAKAAVLDHTSVPSSAATPYQAVAVVHGSKRSAAVKALPDQRFLAGNAPSLPLPPCSLSDPCKCERRHHDRRLPGEMDKRYGGTEKRRAQGRRLTD